MSIVETPEGAPREPAWTLSTALLFVGLWIAIGVTTQIGFVVVAIQVLSFSRGIDTEAAQSQLLRGDSVGVAVALVGCVALSWALTFALLQRLFRRFPANLVRRALGLDPPVPGWSYLAGIPIGLGLFLSSGILLTLLNATEDETPFGELLKSPWGASSITLLAVVIAPLAEEIFFRGFVFPPMARRFSLGTAMAFNGALFAAVHIQSYGAAMRFAYLPPLFLFGFVLSGLRSWTGSVGPGIVAHAVFNFTSILVFLLES